MNTADKFTALSVSLNKGPISSILSFCLVVGIAATIAGLSQEGVPAAGGTFPAKRILTSADGRKLDATILDKTASTIKATRASDGMEFTLELSKLSADDQTFIAGLQELRMTATTETPVVAAGPNIHPGFPDGFKFNKTIILPGKAVFLALPFSKQEKGGICTAASMLNILQYLDPTLQLSQKELFALFNKRTSGATIVEMQYGLKTLGFKGLLQLTNIKKKDLMRRVYGALNDGKPILAGKRGHEITLIGYNKTKGTVILWDQRMPDMKDSNGMPVGSFELTEVAFRSRIVDLIFITPNPTYAEIGPLTQIRETVGITGMLMQHQIFNGNTREETFDEFLRHATEPQIAVNLRKKSRVFLLDGEKEILEITAEATDGGWDCIAYPGGKSEKISKNKILKLMEKSEGIIYSKNPETKP